MSKENNKVDINKHEIDIDTLKKQNVNDLLSIKELYKRIEELGDKITQFNYIDNTIVKKLKKEYEKLKKVVLDENIQFKLTNDIESINSQLDKKASQIETINSQLDKKTSQIETINSQMDTSMKIISNYVNILSFGADKTGINDCSKAFKKAVTYMVSENINALYIPTGKYKIISTQNSSIQLPKECTIFGDGEFSCIEFDDNPNVAKTYKGSSLFVSNNAKNITFKDFKIQGKLMDYLEYKETNAVPFVYIEQEIENITFNNVIMDGCRKLTTHIENVKNATLVNNKILNSLRDGFRLINASNVFAKGNYFKNVSDDSIAIHSNNAFETINQGIIIDGNIFEFSQGIAVSGAKIVDINNNTFKRCPYCCIGISFNKNSDEGNTALHTLKINNNTISDKIYTTWGGADIIKINGQSINDENENIPSLFKAPYNYNYLKGNIIGLPAVHNLEIENNKIIRTLPNVSKISNWGYGNLLSKDVDGCIYDEPVTDYSWSGYGIHLIGSIYNSKINNNTISGIGDEEFLGSGILFDDDGEYLSRYNVEIKNNQIYDIKGTAINFKSGKNANVFLENNIIDLDPFFRNLNHNNDNTWSSNTNSATGIAGNTNGILSVRNKFANCFNPMSSTPTICENNIAFADGRASDFNTSKNKGVDVLGDVNIIQIHGDVSEINFREIYKTKSLNCQDGAILTSIDQDITAVPTTNSTRLTSELISIEIGKRYKVICEDINVRVYPLMSNTNIIQTVDQWRTLPFTFIATHSKVRFIVKHNDGTNITSNTTYLKFMS